MITLKRPLRPLLGMLAVAAGLPPCGAGCACMKRHHTSQFLFLLNPMKRSLLHDPQVQVVLLKRRSQFDR